MPITCIVIFGPHLFWAAGRRSLKFGDCAAGYSAISPSRTASITCGASKKATSNVGLLPLAATSREIWSVPRTIDCVTDAPVCALKAGRMIWRSASLHVPGKVAATSVFDCPQERRGAARANVDALAALISVRRLKLWRSMLDVMEDLTADCSIDRKDPARGRRNRFDIDRHADGAKFRGHLARLIDLERNPIGECDVVNNMRPERHHGLDGSADRGFDRRRLYPKLFGPDRNNDPDTRLKFRVARNRHRGSAG